jgi:hypothetical protein
MPARPFHAVPYAIYCSFHWTGLTLSTTGVYWIVGVKSAAALPSAADCDAVATIAETWLTAGVPSPKAYVASGATCDYIRAWSQAEEGGPEVTRYEATNGSATANDNATESALCELETGIHARGVNGRLFFGPIDGNEPASDGLLSSGYAGQVQNTIKSLLDSFTLGGYAPSVISQKYGICRPILSVRVGRAVAIQSRRMAGRD